MIGRTIAHYEITAKLGEGAMGEVYRATDSRLKRDVAIKLLSSNLAADPELVARMRREAEVLASLSHAHIGQIYGLEQADDSFALVLELVEGETLDERLKKGPLPFDRAVKVAHQIAAALETAHEGGIIHRDLKPANVKRTPAGDVKVLDFGLAKEVRHLHGGTELTQAGAVIGTPAYMSPEQVEGKPLDRRTDIWSFGCVFYEMLTGKRAFAGESIGSLFAAIATEAPDLEPLPRVPSTVRRLIERCLRKDPRTRLRDIGDARVELEEIISGRAEPEPATAAAPRSRAKAPAAIALFLGALLGFLVPRDSSRERNPQPNGEDTPGPPAVRRYSILLRTPTNSFSLDSPTGYSPPLAISPDGRTVAMAGLNEKGERRLHIRRAESFALEELPKTDGADTPFFSPDGTQVGYALYGAGNLRRISLADRAIQTIQESWSVRGTAWLEDDTVVYALAGKGLVRLPLAGGEPEILTELGESDLDHSWPQLLPDRKRLLFTAVTRARGLQPRILSLDTRETVAIDIQGLFARYLPGGYLVYVLGNDLWAVRIDLDTGKTIGRQTKVVSGIHVSQLGNPHIAISESGVLVYEPTRPPSPGRSLVWVDRAGKSTLLDSGKGYEFPRMSPDGRRILFANHKDSSHHDDWVFDIERKVSVPLTSGGNYVSPIWNPEGDAIMFNEFGTGDLYVQKLSESTPRVAYRKPMHWPWGLQWLPRGRVLVMNRVISSRDWSLFELDLEERTMKPLIVTGQPEMGATISHDEKWLAYVSFATGQPEVYVSSYPRIGEKLRVTPGGGVEPKWSPTKRELFFRHGRGLYSIKVPQQQGEAFGKPQLLFEGPYVEGFQRVANYDVAPDGQHFVMVDGGIGLTAGRLEVHLHFHREVELALADPR